MGAAVSVREDLWNGWPAIVLENERLRVTFLVGKGTDLVEFHDKHRDLDLAWVAPGQARPSRDFLESYPGGWQEVLPNGGAPCVYRGASFGQHDSVATVPWEWSIVDGTSVVFSVTTPGYPLSVTKTVRLRGSTLELHETLANEAPVAVEAMWGHHITFGRPFLRPGCRIRLPDGVGVIPHPTPIHPSGRRRVSADRPFAWPGDDPDLSVIPAPGEPSDIVYLTGASWYEIVDPALGGAGMRVEWDARTLPYLWLWHELGATVDYPWWGRAYVVGLEPFSSYPTNGLAEAVANGTALRLGGGESRSLWLTASVIEGESDGGA